MVSAMRAVRVHWARTGPAADWAAQLNVDLRPASSKWPWLGKVAAACPPLFEHCIAEAEAHLDALLSSDALPPGSACAPFWKALPDAVAVESMALRVLPLVLRWLDALRGLKSSDDVSLSLAVLRAAHAVVRVLSAEQYVGAGAACVRGRVGVTERVRCAVCAGSVAICFRCWRRGGFPLWAAVALSSAPQGLLLAR